MLHIDHNMPLKAVTKLTRAAEMND